MTPSHIGFRIWARLRRAAIAACLAPLLASCGTSNTIVIGLAGPFSDPRGLSMKRSAQMAVDEINRGTLLAGKRLELRIVDDSAQSARAIVVAESLRTDSRVVAVIGHLTSAPTLAAAAVYNSGSNPVVEISPSASSPDLSGVGSYTFRLCATDLAHGPALAKFAFEKLGVRHIAIIYQNDDYGRGIVTTFRAEFLRRGGVIDEQDPVLGAATDPTPYLDRIQRDGKAGAIMLAADRPTAAISLRMLRQRGMTMPVLGGDALTGIQAEGDIAEGVYLTSSWLPDNPTPASVAFVQAYQAAFSGDKPDHRGAGAYDAVHLIASAIKARGASRSGVRTYLSALGTMRGSPAYQGVTGLIQFDGQGDIRGKSVVVGVVRGGQIVPAEQR